MCNARYNAHADPLFKEPKILNIRDIFNLNCLKFYHKCKNQELPNFFNNMFTTNADIHSYHTRRRNDLHYISYNTEGACKRIWHAIPSVINELPPLVRENLKTLNLKQFTNYYKSFDIDSYEVACHINQCYICNRRWCNGRFWGKVVNPSVKSTIKWIHGYFVKKSLSFIKHPLIIITL